MSASDPASNRPRRGGAWHLLVIAWLLATLAGGPGPFAPRDSHGEPAPRVRGEAAVALFCAELGRTQSGTTPRPRPHRVAGGDPGDDDLDVDVDLTPDGPAGLPASHAARLDTTPSGPAATPARRRRLASAPVQLAARAPPRPRIA